MAIRSDPRRFQDARTWVTEIAVGAGFLEHEAHHLSLAVSEACANAYVHAYGRKNDGRIDLQVVVENGDLYMTVRDYGTTFDFSRYQPPDLSSLPEGGYGIFLMRELMDEVRYTSMAVGTRVELVKRSRRAEVGSSDASRGGARS
jgi:serine/threonine-protein kinase RsbW